MIAEFEAQASMVAEPILDSSAKVTAARCAAAEGERVSAGHEGNESSLSPGKVVRQVRREYSETVSRRVDWCKVAYFSARSQPVIYQHAASASEMQGGGGCSFAGYCPWSNKHITRALWVGHLRGHLRSKQSNKSECDDPFWHKASLQPHF